MATLGLPGDDVPVTEVWGRQAQARLGTQALFPAELRDGWRVTAAGCTPRSDQPSDRTPVRGRRPGSAPAAGGGASTPARSGW